MTIKTAVHGAMGCGQKKSFKVVWRSHQLLSGILANGHLLRMLCLSANDKGDNKMISEAVYRSPGIYLTVEKNLGKPQLGDRLIKTMRPVIASNGVPYLQMIAQHVRKAEERKEGKDGVGP